SGAGVGRGAAGVGRGSLGAFARGRVTAAGFIRNLALARADFRLGALAERLGVGRLVQVAPVETDGGVAVAGSLVRLTDLEEQDRVAGDLVGGQVLTRRHAPVSGGGGMLALLVVRPGRLDVAWRPVPVLRVGPRGGEEA